MENRTLLARVGFIKFRRHAILAAFVSFCGLGLSASHGQTILQNFDGFADTSALDATISGATPNATITLSANAGVGGSQALIFHGNNGASPYYTQFTLNLTPFSLSGLTAVTLQIQGIGNAGSQENFNVVLLESGVSIAAGPNVNTQSISTGSFDTYTIGFSGLSDTIDALRFTYGAIDYGNTQVTVDNIATVGPIPEPASLIFGGLGLGMVTFVLRRRGKS